jgi:hypothetical protein
MALVAKALRHRRGVDLLFCIAPTSAITTIVVMSLLFWLVSTLAKISRPASALRAAR